MPSSHNVSQIISIFGRVMNVGANQVSMDTSPETLDNWDSLRHMNLMMALEEELNVTFNEDEVLSMLSMQAIVDTLNSKGFDIIS
jgi:acyl carrier protein